MLPTWHNSATSVSNDSGDPQESLRLTPDELTFARRLYRVFGPGRFTPRRYYLDIRGGRAPSTSEQDVIEIYQAITAHSRVLLPAPGVRGDDGWCLSPEALDALLLTNRLEETVLY